MPTYRFTDPDTGDIREIEVTDEQAEELMAGHALMRTTPDVPDEVRIEPGGEFVEHEDWRPDESDS